VTNRTAGSIVPAALLLLTDIGEPVESISQSRKQHENKENKETYREITRPQIKQSQGQQNPK